MLILSLGCAPIDVSSKVSVEPRAAPVRSFGVEQLAARDFVADYVQLGPRVLVELREHRSCTSVRHVPVMRVEDIDRTNRGFVAWDFALGSFCAGFAALAFARPRLFSDRLIDGQGRVVYDSTGAYVVGGVFTAVAVGLLTAGIVDAIRSTDTVRYAEAFEVELGPERPCTGDADEGRAVADRRLRLIVDQGVVELEATTDAEGRARFELPAWPGPIPDGGRVAAVLEIARADGHDVEPRILALSLKVPFDAMIEAHTGVADTRARPATDVAVELPASEGPSP